ncbi:MAG: hypothetical protein B6241_11620 [Spirochaetaceae bacterium 4572_59]|nr:MAG: hypothetical protein B6241_11620 [Spirochaetaceae bacterium 4572_59]
MNKFKRYISVVSLLILIAGTLSAQVIRSIDIEGLKKTKASTVKGIIGYHEGDSIESGCEDGIRQDLVKSGLFVNDSIDVQLESSENDAYIRIYLKDRVSLIPIPVASFSGGDFSGAVFVMDRNFLGYGHQFFTGGMYSLENKMFMLGYSNPAFMGSSFSLGGMMGVYDNEVKVTSIDGGDTLALYDQTTVRLGVNWGWDLKPYQIKFGTDGSFLSISLSANDIFKFSQDGKFIYNSLYYDTYFTEGLKSSLCYELQSFTDGFDLTQSIQGSLSYQFLLNEHCQIQLSADSGYSEGEDLQSLFLKYGYSWSILPGDVLADRFVQGDIKVVFAALDFSWGYLAVPLTYQAGFMDGISGDNEFFHGPAGGMAIYLKKVAFPAMSFRYAYNVETGNGEFNFNVGMSM